MTREEAIDVVRNIYQTDKEKEALVVLIPELAESDDERIRKEIIDYLGLVGKGDGDYAQPMIDRWIAYLEKQKENPKTANSIPSDCTSDAKSEDIWHKVEDSLPDNPREVLCKDEAGNYFIGRYYVGEGWEISNYDDEDKPHHLNPPVSKWIDFPSEKQKEQKPEWSVDDEEMMTDIIESLEYAYPNDNEFRIAWLRSLRPQPHWKPSEGEMKALQNAVALTACDKELTRLYNQLKKLM